jgi:hypothetical protein
MTTEEIYELTSETTEQEARNIMRNFTEAQEKSVETLTRLGDSLALAVWTIVAKKYNKKDNDDFYYNAHFL